MISHQHARHLQPAQVLRQLPAVVYKAGRFDDDRLTRLFQNKDLIAEGIVGLVGMERNTVKVIAVDLALLQLERSKAIFVHDAFLHKNIRFLELFQGVGPCSDEIISALSAVVK